MKVLNLQYSGENVAYIKQTSLRIQIKKTKIVFVLHFIFFLCSRFHRLATDLRGLFVYATLQESSCAQYIIQQYIAAVGGLKLLNEIKNFYTRGKVRMLTTEFETATRVTKDPIKAAENGWFVLWQMLPDKWHVEMELEGHTVQSGSDGNVVWRSTSWLGAHLAKGPLRPLRRTMQVLV